MSNHYVNIYEEYKHKFFQLPKVFFTNPKYMKMSNNAKVAWALLCDRSSLSRKNGWYDKETGRIYFIFTNQDLMKLLNINSKTTLSNIKKELESLNLIESHRIGINKPNKMYLLYPEITENDMYAIDELEEYEYDEYKRINSAKPQEGQGSPENGRPENGRQEVQKMDSSNTDYSDTDLINLDTNIDTKDTKKEPFQDKMESILKKENKNQKELYIKRAFFENNDVIPKQLANMLEVFSDTPEKAEVYYDIILTAKRNAEKDTDTLIWLEHEPELLHEIINSFSRAIRKIEKERNIQNIKGYIYKSIYDLLIKEMTARIRRTNTQKGVYYNWLEK